MSSVSLEQSGVWPNLRTAQWEVILLVVSGEYHLLFSAVVSSCRMNEVVHESIIGVYHQRAL